MNYTYFYRTDIGTTRENNQDSVYAGAAELPHDKAFLGLVCDGMGGLANGEFASRTVVEHFRNWFESGPAEAMLTGDILGNIFACWDELIRRANDTLIDISLSRNEAMGTTLSALLLYNGQYYAAQLGDSRIYHYSNGHIYQVTKDHSYVMDMVSKGMMTENEAMRSQKRNVLTRCVGVYRNIRADYFIGPISENDGFLLCSDGFHNGTLLYEMEYVMSELSGKRRSKGEKLLTDFIERRKQFGEKDNITALAVFV